MDDVGGPLGVNPFSPAAVAQVVLTGEPPVTLPTGAIDAATGHLAAYLTPGPGERRDVRPDGTPLSGQRTGQDGFVMAIVGDYGTGKTHLAVHLLRQARQVAEREGQAGSLVVHWGYLDARPGGFDRMYREFFELIDRDELLLTVRDHYADVVADALGNSELTGRTAQQLRNREIDPDDVVDGLGLMDSLLSRQLRDELVDVTDRPAFGTALTMLLRRKEFADDIWRWLGGGPPTPALEERGITEPISGDDLALQAMGVFACLYGRRHHRLVLVIDELDRVLTGDRAAERVGAVKKLFEVFQAARACLVVVGLPELLELLDEPDRSARERIAYTIKMPALDSGDVRRLIELTHGRAGGPPTLAPFAEGTPDLIAKLGRGSARQIIRLCHRAYQHAIVAGSDRVDEEAIRHVAHARDELPARSQVAAESRRILRARGLTFRQGFTPPGAGQEVDLWVTAGGPRGVAIVITGSVVTEADAAGLAALAQAVRQVGPGSQALLVVTGYQHADLRARLVDAFDTEPLEFSRRDFDLEFDQALSAALTRLHPERGQDVPDRVLQRLSWVSQQQVQAQGHLERLALRVDDLRASLEHQLAAVRRELREPSPPVAANPLAVLPGPVDEAFTEALDALREVEWMRPWVRDTLRVSEETAEVMVRQRALLARLNTATSYAAIGATSLLRDLVEGFRVGVEEWYGLGHGRVNGPTGLAGRDLLLSLCQTYESIYFAMQRSRVDDYPMPPRQLHSVSRDTEQAAWTRAGGNARDLLGNLGMRVQEAAWRSAIGSTDEA